MANAIVIENQKTGNPDTEWDIGIGGGSTSIEGFATDISVNLGGTVSFKINTASSYQIKIYRMGYYKGLGGRLVASSGSGVTLLRNPSPQSAPLTPAGDAGAGLIDAGNWLVSATWVVPNGGVSGVYIALLIGSSGKNHIPFVVRDDNTAHDIVFQPATPPGTPITDGMATVFMAAGAPPATAGPTR